MAEPTIRQLRYFEALSRHLHFGRAAEECAVTQPALSMQLADLEGRLGVALVERRPRSVILTEAGREVARRAAAIVLAVGEIGEIARTVGGAEAGTVRLGAIPTVAPYLLPELFGRLRAAAPGIDLRMRETRTEALLRELSIGEIDAAILALPIAAGGLSTMALFEEPFLLVRPVGDGRGSRVDPACLDEMRLLLLEEGHCFRDQALALCSRVPAAARDRLDASSLSTLVQMVGAGMGVTLIPRIAAAIETRAANVAVSPLGPPEPTRRIGLVWRESSPLAARYEAIGHVAREAAAACLSAE